MAFDRFDALTLLGVLLIGVAAWLAFGLPGTLAYVGLLCVLLGVNGAMRTGPKGQG